MLKQPELKQLFRSKYGTGAKFLRNKTKILKDLEKHKDSFLSATLKNVGVLCLSKDSKNILMWSHYAQNHTGFVIEFKINLIPSVNLNPRFEGITCPAIASSQCSWSMLLCPMNRQGHLPSEVQRKVSLIQSPTPRGCAWRCIGSTHAKIGEPPLSRTHPDLSNAGAAARNQQDRHQKHQRPYRKARRNQDPGPQRHRTDAQYPASAASPRN